MLYPFFLLAVRINAMKISVKLHAAVAAFSILHFLSAGKPSAVAEFIDPEGRVKAS